MLSGPRHTLSRHQRIRRRSDFRHIQTGGRKVHTRHFIVAILPHAGPGRRLGITVSRKVGPAVARNRVKRLVREVFRRNQTRFPQECDIVFIAKRGASELDYPAVLREVSRAASAMAQAASSHQSGIES